MAVAHGAMRRYSLRTLVLISVFGAPLLALAWFGGIYLWYAAPDPLRHLAQHWFLPGMLIALFLVVYSLVYSPRDSTERTPLSRLPAIGLIALQFLVLLHWSWITLLALGWAFVWGDNSSPLQEMVLPFAAIVAVTTAGLTAVRYRIGMATHNYYQVVFTLTIALLCSPLRIGSRDCRGS